MKTRIITAAITLTLFVPFLIFSDTWAFPILMAFLSFVGVLEVLKCSGCKNPVIIVLSLLLGASSPLLARMTSIVSLDLYFFISIYFPVFFLFLLVCLTCSVFSHGRYQVDVAAMNFLSVFYIVTSFTSIVFLRDTTVGKYIYLLTFIGPWISDTFAYFFGRLLGKHKLIEDVSPKKTIEGSIAGIVFTGVACVIYGIVLVHAIHAKFEPSFVALFVIGIVISVISQIGDLSASLIKRHFNVKDYGKIFPGHGGVMDRFDSVLPIAPLLLMATMILTHYNIFNKL